MNQTIAGPLLSSIHAPDDLLDVHGIALNPVPNGTYWTDNPNEGVYPADWDNGKMDGFAANSGSPSMTYFSSFQYAVEWDLAQEYAIADRYFSSCLCETLPNRLFSLAGYGAGETEDFDPPPYIPVNQSVFSELGRYGVSWGYFVEDHAAGIQPLNYFDGIGAYSSQIQRWSNFYSDLQGGQLPSVNWVMPFGGGSTGLDQHPSANVTAGEDWVLNVVDDVMQSPYWNSTAIFITYDEGGGYYDHVPPPIVDGCSWVSASRSSSSRHMQRRTTSPTRS